MTDDSDHPRSQPPSSPDANVPGPDAPVPGPTILISNRQDLPVDEDGLATLAGECLVGEGFPLTELSVSFVTDEEMADLHVRYLGEDGPTDVLSFGLGESPNEEAPGEVAPAADGALVLGDVVIAPAYAARNARAGGGGADAELRLLLVHGILHLLGHDHEADDERTAMWARQERYSGVRA